MNLFLIGLLCFMAAAYPVQCSVDLTLEVESSGTPVVQACIAKISEAVIFSYDQQMLRRIAYVETRDGEDPDTYSDPSNNGGIWQLSLVKYEATKVNVSSKLLEDIYKTFQINWTDTTWSDLRIPLYSALAARLYMEVIPDPIPLSIRYTDLQANYWADHYTSSGDASSKFSSDVNQLLITEICEASALDLIFLLDESGSVGNANFAIMRNLVHAIVFGYDVRPDRVRVGSTSFSNIIENNFNLNTYSTKSEVLTAILDIPYHPGLTFTHLGLEYVLNHGFTEQNGTRPISEGVPRVLVVITDGRSSEPLLTVEAAEAVHNAGIVVFAIGIGGANITELNLVASKPADVYYISSFDATEVSNLQTPLREETCHASSKLSIDDVIRTELDPEKFKNVNYPLPASNDTGLIVKLNSTGSCTLYGSSVISTPNEALHDILIDNLFEMSGEAFVSPEELAGSNTADAFYVTAVCTEASNITIEVDTLQSTGNEGIDTGNGSSNASSNGSISVTGFGCVTDLNGELIDDDTTVELTWTAPTDPNGEITGYRVIYIGHRGTQDGYLHHGPLEEHAYFTSITVYGLRPGYIYEFKVQVETSNGISPENNTVVVLVPPNTEPMFGDDSAPAAPVNVRGEFVSADSVVISWDPPSDDDNIIYYQLLYTGYESQQENSSNSTDQLVDGPYEQIIELSNDTYEATVLELRPGYYYEFQVGGANLFGTVGENSTIVVLVPQADATSGGSSDQCDERDTFIGLFVAFLVVSSALLLVLIFLCLKLRRKKKTESEESGIQDNDANDYEDPIVSDSTPKKAPLAEGTSQRRDDKPSQSKPDNKDDGSKKGSGETTNTNVYEEIPETQRKDPPPTHLGSYPKQKASGSALPMSGDPPPPDYININNPKSTVVNDETERLISAGNKEQVSEKPNQSSNEVPLTIITDDVDRTSQDGGDLDDDDEDFETWKKNKPTYTAKTLTGSLGLPRTQVITISLEDISTAGKSPPGSPKKNSNNNKLPTELGSIGSEPQIRSISQMATMDSIAIMQTLQDSDITEQLIPINTELLDIMPTKISGNITGEGDGTSASELLQVSFLAHSDQGSSANEDENTRASDILNLFDSSNEATQL